MKNHKVFIPVVNKINKQSGVVVLRLIDQIDLQIKSDKLRIKNGYAFSSIHNEYLHRLVMPDCLIVDHKDKNKLNCDINNLRESNYSLNKANSKAHLNRKYKGVRKSWSKYRSTIVFNGKQIHLGMFDSEIDAAVAYNNAAVKYFGEHSELNNV
jgi:hypothetical protein